MSVYYSDASYSPQHKVGVIGYKKRNDKVHLRRTKKKGSTNCELQSFIRLLSKADENDLIIYTDCNKVIQLVTEQHRWRDILKYEKFYKRYDFYTKNKSVEVRKLVGHSKKEFKDEHDLQFQAVDLKVRKKLRKITAKLDKK